MKTLASLCASFALAAALSTVARADEPRDIPPEAASEGARNIEKFPPQREAEGVRVGGQNIDNVYATAGSGEMPDHNQMIRYIRSASANAAEIEEATKVDEVLVVDVSSLFEGEEGEALEGVVQENAERVGELQSALDENQVAHTALEENGTTAQQVVAVQLEASGVMTAYVR